MEIMLTNSDQVALIAVAILSFFIVLIAVVTYIFFAIGNRQCPNCSSARFSQYKTPTKREYLCSKCGMVWYE